MPLPSRHGLYEPTLEHDACGLGFVAHLRGEKSRAIVEQGLDILQRLSHRAATGADPQTGDGAGILLQLPDPFFRKEGLRLGFEMPEPRCYAVGQVFLPADPAARAACERGLRRGHRGRGPAHPRLARRPGRRLAARLARPALDAGAPAGLRRAPPGGALGLRAEAVRHPQAGGEPHPRRAAGPRAAASTSPSLSSETIVYKGLMLPAQLASFYQDLQDPEMESGARAGPLALHHQHLPHLGAGAAVPLHRPQRGDQHPPRQPEPPQRPPQPALRPPSSAAASTGSSPSSSPSRATRRSSTTCSSCWSSAAAACRTR